MDVRCPISLFTSVTTCVDMPEHMKAISHAQVLRSVPEIDFSHLLSYGEVSVNYMLLKGYHASSQMLKSGSSLC